MNNKYDINQCALYKCSSKKRLEHLLNIEPGDLKNIDYVIKYNNFEIAKKNSDEMRKITAPEYTIKTIQRRILYLLQKVIRPEWLISGEKGKSYINNGKVHLGNNYALAIDIKKFYDNCKREPVYQFFKQKLMTSSDVAEILTNIVTFEGGIPTGCPTSQIIAYYAYEDMFNEISKIALKYNCTFSLYVDDMTFSSKKTFNPKSLAREVDIILRRYGHTPKYKKVKYYSKDEPFPVTGTIVSSDGKLIAPNSLQKKIYDNFQNIKNIDNSIKVCDEDQKKKILSIKGQIQAAKYFDSRKFPEIERIVNLYDLQLSNTPNKNKQKKHSGKIKIKLKRIGNAG